MVKHKRPRYLHTFPDRHGKPRAYYNKPGRRKVPLPLPLYTEEFWIAYHKAEAGAETPKSAGEVRSVSGSVADLIARYFDSPEFASLADSSRRNFRRQLERFREKHGHRSVKLLDRATVKTIIGNMRDKPNAANKLLDRLKVLLNFAVDIELIKASPAAGMKGFKVVSEGFHTWSEDEIGRYLERHPEGSKARLAMALMLFTGQRRSDAVRMGWQHVKGDMIGIRQRKTHKLLWIPLHPALKAILDQTPRTNMTFLLTEYGKPFTGNGFGNKMREWCDQAGLPECSSHGLRKAMATRLAEAGATTEQIKAVTGHETDAEVSRYTKAASQKKLAGSAMLLIESEPGTKSANPHGAVSKKEQSSL
ncbi:MAG: tyrosine-type recombinase/integrase [Proteobacteria bacterium]|nr:tyrosine-type recombinase/integrase [Pseudomonadota bacterium]